MDKRDTVGSKSVELIQKHHTNDHTAAEQGEAMLKDYEKNLLEAVLRGLKDFSGNFYITVLTKKERLLQNVIRNYFIVRESCPTPDYDQSVYRYIRVDDSIEYLWTIPSLPTCRQMRDYPLEVDPEERELRNFVLDFYDGTLSIKARKLNKELS